MTKFIKLNFSSLSNPTYISVWAGIQMPCATAVSSSSPFPQPTRQDDDADDDDDDDKIDDDQKRTKEHELSRLVSQQLTVNKREYV